ncbi:hypothetical protein LR48_Vigan232s000300 [Vigna angularis]|uniref:Uncharacterized protein n=1 Tax=Phaseolus angularis TaxID=3914 RepID=A0A0L9T6Z9_PHAAN|nr:hypothetical protein LR48_Vigan232s000300 [Vigna angularis]
MVARRMKVQPPPKESSVGGCMKKPHEKLGGCKMKRDSRPPPAAAPSSQLPFTACKSMATQKHPAGRRDVQLHRPAIFKSMATGSIRSSSSTVAGKCTRKKLHTPRPGWFHVQQSR